MLENDPHLRTSQRSNESDIWQKSQMGILPNSKFHPYKVRLVQELPDNDCDRYDMFAHIFIGKCYDLKTIHFFK